MILYGSGVADPAGSGTLQLADIRTFTDETSLARTAAVEARAII